MENVLFERIDVSVGDIFIDKDFKQYKVYLVDEREHYAKAELIGEKKRLGVTKKSLETIGNRNIDKKICLYMTHNDEMYTRATELTVFMVRVEFTMLQTDLPMNLNKGELI